MSRLYIPIWLYSNSSIHHLQSQHIFFTFQSGYIQIIDITSSEQIETNLYIPIWFYSNEKAMSDKGLRYMLLHSNLVIFKCRKNSCIKNACHPLHSNLVIFKSNIEKCSKINSHLYIPIWFYSNCIAFFSSSICKYFTFQSGSIQIKWSMIICKNYKLLYMPIWFYSNRPLDMFMSEVDTLYIPIWFYSNFLFNFYYAYFFSLYIPIWFYSNYVIFPNWQYGF